MTGVEWRPSERGLEPHVDGVPVAWAPQAGGQRAFLECPLDEVLLEGNRGGGKRVHERTLVATDRGWVRAGEVTFGDRLVAKDGSYVRILGIFPGWSERLFRLTFEDGATVDACADHRWLVRGGRNGPRDGWVVKTTREMVHSHERWSIPYVDAPLPGVRWGGPDAYVVGLILGDGTLGSRDVTVYSDDEEILTYLESRHGWRLYKYDDRCARATCTRGSHVWRSVLPREKGADKRIPAALLDADPTTRLELLRGLMDSDGCCDIDGRCEFASVSPHLATGVQYLVRSLGGRASIHWAEKASSFGSRGYWRVKLSPRGRFVPFRLERKARRVKRRHYRSFFRSVRSIEEVPGGNGVCFSVNHPSRCFVVEGCVVTHNTDALLMDFGQHVGQGYGAEWRGVLFRQTFPQLADVVSKTKKWFNRIWPSAAFNESKYQWAWPTGEALLFRYMEREDDYWHYHGHAYPWVGWEELTTWPSDTCYRVMMSCCRSTRRGLPRKYRANTNPYGPGHNWVKARFRLGVPRGHVLGPTVEEGGRRRVAVHSSLSENLVLLHSDPRYPDTIAMAASNPAMRAAWGPEGSWDITSGGMFDDLWSPAHHVLPDIPWALLRASRWRLNRAYDHGQSRPYSVGWYAESNGEPIRLPGGREVGHVPGDLFRVAELYGWCGRANEGTNEYSAEIAGRIVAAEAEWGMPGLFEPGPADSQIWLDNEGKSSAGEFRRRGVLWLPCDKRPGARKQGWEKMRGMLMGAVPGKEGLRERPGLFVCESCEHFLRTVPGLTRKASDPDDIDKSVSEDHVADEVRYRVLERDSAPGVQDF